MPIDTSKPFSRENWNDDILTPVNDLCQNPDPECDPLPIIPLVEPLHIWTKTDVTTVQDKLIEICPENTFDDLDTPQLWSHPDIIVPIEEAITRGWCSCQPEETEYDLGYFPQVTIEAAVKEAHGNPTVRVDSGGCGGNVTWTYESPWYAPADNSAVAAIALAAYQGMQIDKSNYRTSSYLIFWLDDTIETLEDEIAVLEARISAIEDTELPAAEAALESLTEFRDYYCTEYPGGTECTTYTALVAAKEAEIAELEEEVEDKQDEVETKEGQIEPYDDLRDEQIVIQTVSRAGWDSRAQVQWAAYQSHELQFQQDLQPIRDYFPEMSEPWGDYWEDTRNWRVPLWTFTHDKHDDGSISATRVGEFSPGGYPCYLSYGSGAFLEIVVTCKFYTWNWFHDCFCPWEIQFQGTPRCERDEITWWKAVTFGQIQRLWGECANVSESDYRLRFKVKHAVEYTRPS